MLTTAGTYALRKHLNQEHGGVPFPRKELTRQQLRWIHAQQHIPGEVLRHIEDPEKDPKEA